MFGFGFEHLLYVAENMVCVVLVYGVLNLLSGWLEI